MLGLRDLAEEFTTPVIDLDELAVRDAVATDPALFASATAPVLIDEFQHVPDLLDAVKSELNRDLRPGRYVLTGSTSYTSGTGIDRASAHHSDLAAQPG